MNINTRLRLDLGEANSAGLAGGVTAALSTQSNSASVVPVASSVSLSSEGLAAAAQDTYTVKQALALWRSDPSARGVVIRDNSRNLQMGWDQLVANQAGLDSVTQTNAGAALVLTRDQFATGINVLNSINSGAFKATVLGAKVADLTAIQSYGSKIGAFTVLDSAANLTANLSALDDISNMASIELTEGRKTALTVGATDLADHADLFQKFRGGKGTFNVVDSAASVVAARTDVLALGKRVSITVQDTAANLSASLSDLNTLGKRLSAIEHTDSGGSYALSMSELNTYQKLFGKVAPGDLSLDITDSAAAIQSKKGWRAVTQLSSSISSLTVSDGALTLNTSQLMSGGSVLSTLSSGVELNIEGKAGGVTKAFSQLMSLSEQIASVDMKGRGYVGMTAATYAQATDLLAKFTSDSVSVAIDEADVSDLEALFADTQVKTINVRTDAASATADAFAETLADDRIKQLSVTGATVAQLLTLSDEKKLRSIDIQDDTSVLSTSESLDAIHGVMRRKRNLVEAVRANDPELMSVSYADYQTYGKTVFKAQRNFALQVDFSAEIPDSVTDPATLRNWAQTSAKSNGSFQVRLWDGTKGKYGAAMSLGRGVNFVKFGQVATFLDSGDRDLNTVLYGGTFKWMQNATALAPTSSTDELKSGVYSLGNGSARTTIKYSFLTDVNQLSTSKDQQGFAAMNAQQQQAVTQAVNYISSLVNIKFELVADPASADIRFGTNDQGSVSGGYATGANPALGTVNLLLNNAASVNDTPTPGDYGWSTVVHEIGHTLGLKHPGPYNAGGGVPQGPFLARKDDSTRMSVMSYKAPADAYNWVSNGAGGYSRSSVNAFTYMPLDILALQFLYGKNTSGVSQTDGSKSLADYQVTSFDDNWQNMETLVAGGSGLSMDLSAVSGDNVVDLRGGAYSSINILSETYNSQITSPLKQTFFNLNNVGLAWGSQVTMVEGGSGSDVIYADAYSTSINGGDGTDKVFLYGSAQDWEVTTQGNQSTYVNGDVSIAMTDVEAVGYYDADRTSNLHSRLDLTA